ncbi:MAG: M23 family metallopeptidase [Candidatus Neomarinimicrobiota bacterium]
MSWLPSTKTRISRGFRFVVLRDNDSNVHQWSLSRNTFLAVSFLAIVLCSVLLFFTADFMTGILYQARLNEIQENSRSVTDLLLDTQDRLDRLGEEVEEIEEKDRALRTYANLPPIDTDIRKVGVGGMKLRSRASLADVMPDIESRVSKLQLNLDELSRKVKLEKESYETIYRSIRTQSDMLSSIPSINPVRGGYFNTGFGNRRDPFTSEERFHQGLDISATRGTPVYAAADGNVAYSGYRGSYGKTIKINHGRGYQSLYAHLHRINVGRGRKIKRGDIIGEVGNTGRSTAPHLHYEVHYYGTPQNPQNYFFTGPLR